MNQHAAMPTDSVPKQTREPSTPVCVRSTAAASPVASGTGAASALRPLLVSNGRSLAGRRPPSRSPLRLPRSLPRASLRRLWSALPVAARRITKTLLASRPRATSAIRAETSKCRAYPVSKPLHLFPCRHLLPRAHRTSTSPRQSSSPSIEHTDEHAPHVMIFHCFCFYQHTHIILAFYMVYGKGYSGSVLLSLLARSFLGLISSFSLATEENGGAKGYRYGRAFIGGSDWPLQPRQGEAFGGLRHCALAS